MNGKFDQDNDEKFYGFYRAVVEDIDDSSDNKGRGRVKVRVLGIHSANDIDDDEDGIPVDNLPWAEQAAPLFGGFSGDNTNISGIKSIPSVGSIVWVFFENGNHNRPVYFATVPGDNDFASTEVGSGEDADNITTILTKEGHKITINDDPDEDLNIKIEDVTSETEHNTIEFKKSNSADGTKYGININGEKQLCTRELIEDIIKPMITDLLQHSHPPFSMPSPTLAANFPSYLQQVVQGLLVGTDTILTERTRAN